MKALKKNSENLQKVGDSICEFPFCQGKFTYWFKSDSLIVLESIGREGIGSYILRLIPCNYKWHVSFFEKSLRLYICTI